MTIASRIRSISSGVVIPLRADAVGGVDQGALAWMDAARLSLPDRSFDEVTVLVSWSTEPGPTAPAPVRSRPDRLLELA
jgi:hypothetical protein